MYFMQFSVFKACFFLFIQPFYNGFKLIEKYGPDLLTACAHENPLLVLKTHSEKFALKRCELSYFCG